MTRAISISIRTMTALAVVFLTLLIVSNRMSAQTSFDVKAVSAADAADLNGEFPLNFEITYANGQVQQVSITGEGSSNHPAPVAATGITSIKFNGEVKTVAEGVLVWWPWRCGCWRLCWRWWSPWWCFQRRPRLFWYWDPCCP